MKLVIFSPIIKTSSIALSTASIVEPLYAKGCEIKIVRTEAPALFSEPVYDILKDALHWNNYENVWRNIKDADGFIYQVGDNYSFHQGVLQWLPQLPGVVCLHDFFLGHLFREYSQNHIKEANSLFDAWYKDSPQHFSSYADPQSFIEGMRTDSPMTEWICSMGLGVITHGRWGIDRVLAACPGPVYVVPLSHGTRISDSSVVQVTRNSPGQFKLLTIGHVNLNKRIDKVIAAIGSSPNLRKHTVYSLAGMISPELREQLSQLAIRYQVKLNILGEVDDLTLQQTIEESDAISCLRWPVLEAASGSAIQGMLYGKPMMVTDAGFYAELPDDCVKKINPDDEINAIVATLEWFYKNIELRSILGRKAQQWARETFTAENYAEKLIGIIFNVNKAKPIIDASQFFVKMMLDWGASDQLIHLKDTLKPLSIFERGDPEA